MFLIILTALGTTDAGCYGYGCGTEGVWISWGSWSTCSSSCGIGNQVRTRSCSQVGGCSGLSQVTQQCQRYGYGCGTKGVWSSWESWSPCSSSCGLGNQVRTRSCSQVGGCSGSSQATQQCQGYGYGCGTGKCTYRGRTYGEGAQIQTAAGCNTCTCLVNGNLSCTEKFCPSVSNCTTVGGPDAGSACIFPFTFDGVKYTKCTTHRDMDGKAWCSTFTDSRGTHVGGQGNWGYCGGVCGMDPKGLWTPWGAWGTCSSSCGVGSQVRTRSCSQGLCSGSSKATQQCQGIGDDCSPQVTCTKREGINKCGFPCKDCITCLLNSNGDACVSPCVMSQGMGRCFACVATESPACLTACSFDSLNVIGSNFLSPNVGVDICGQSPYPCDISVSKTDTKEECAKSCSQPLGEATAAAWVWADPTVSGPGNPNQCTCKNSAIIEHDFVDAPVGVFGPTNPIIGLDISNQAPFDSDIPAGFKDTWPACAGECSRKSEAVAWVWSNPNIPGVQEPKKCTCKNSNIEEKQWVQTAWAVAGFIYCDDIV